MVASRTTAELRSLEEWRLLLARPGPLQPRALRKATQSELPPVLRGAIWQRLLHLPGEGRERLAFYKEFLAAAADDCEFAREIARDIDRTFPSHKLFRESTGHGQQQLMRVLVAAAARHPSVGYCQGMGFIAGVLLTSLPEQDVFFAFDFLMQDLHMREVFEPNLGRLPLMFFQLRKLLAEHLPKLFAHFRREQVDASMFAASWFMTLFSSTANPEVALRLLDLIFAEGYAAVLRISVSILRLLEPTLLQKSFEGILATLKNWNQEVESAETLLAAAEAYATDISLAHVEKLEELFRQEQQTQGIAGSK